jgi:hypothetical protein
MSRKKKKLEQPVPGVNESIEDYMNSKAYKDSFTNITISSFEEQEESMREYWAAITPLQRLQHLFILVKMAFGLTPEKLENPGLKMKLILSLMMNIFLKEHYLLLEKLINARVEFIIVGGYAVNYHGYNRTTGDLDLWIKPDR